MMNMIQLPGTDSFWWHCLLQYSFIQSDNSQFRTVFDLFTTHHTASHPSAIDVSKIYIVILSTSATLVACYQILNDFCSRRFCDKRLLFM